MNISLLFCDILFSSTEAEGSLVFSFSGISERLNLNLNELKI